MHSALLLSAILTLSGDTPPLRPADGPSREGLHLPPPREAGVVLSDIQAVPAWDSSNPGPGETWAQLKARNLERDTRIVNLVSELQESGYRGDKLLELLVEKMTSDVRVFASRARPLNEALAQMWEVRDAHVDDSTAAFADLTSWVAVLPLMRNVGLHPSEADLDKIAQAEIAAAKGPGKHYPGSVLERALTDQPARVREEWLAWAAEHPPADAQINVAATRERGFDKPIRIQGTGLDGVAIDTAQWAGSVILVDFWGSWCGPCKAELPTIKRLEGTYGGRGFRVLGVMVDQPGAGREFLKGTRYDWPQLVDPAAGESKEAVPPHFLCEKYAVREFPTLWLIDRKGILRKAPRGEKELEARVVELLMEGESAGGGEK